MSQFLKMNPTLRDYVFLNGSPIPSDRIEERAYFSLALPKNNWLYGDVNDGSLLYKLQGIKRTGSVEQTYASYAQDALRIQMINRGFAQSSSVTNLAATQTGTLNQIDIVPAAVQPQSQLNFVPV